jgi:hypothetical protein
MSGGMRMATIKSGGDFDDGTIVNTCFHGTFQTFLAVGGAVAGAAQGGTGQPPPATLEHEPLVVLPPRPPTEDRKSPKNTSLFAFKKYHDCFLALDHRKPLAFLPNTLTRLLYAPTVVPAPVLWRRIDSLAFNHVCHGFCWVNRCRRSFRLAVGG